MELVHEETRGKYDIKLYFLPEYEQPDWDFQSEEEEKETLDKIESGTLLYFCAKVAVYLDGRELGSDYLGGCCYSSVEEFIQDSYYQDMTDNAIEEADNFLAVHCG